MYQGQTVFSQVMDFLPEKKFRQRVNRYSGNYRVRSFTCYDQLLVMDRAYLDFERLYPLHQSSAVFVTRSKTNTGLRRIYSHKAVKTQIRIAVSTYVLVAIMKKRLKINLTLYTILQTLSISLFEKMPILKALSTENYKNQITSGHIQLKLFES